MCIIQIIIIIGLPTCFLRIGIRCDLLQKLKRPNRFLLEIFAHFSVLFSNSDVFFVYVWQTESKCLTLSLVEVLVCAVDIECTQ